MTSEEFLTQQGDTLHIRLLMYYNQYTNAEEKDNQKDTDNLVFGFPEGDYVITYLDLKKKADEETIGFSNKHNIPLSGATITNGE